MIAGPILFVLTMAFLFGYAIIQRRKELRIVGSRRWTGSVVSFYVSQDGSTWTPLGTGYIGKINLSQHPEVLPVDGEPMWLRWKASNIDVQAQVKR